MKNNIFSLIFVCTSMFLYSCSKSSSNDNSSSSTLSNTPLAKAQFDNSNYGIYKGVFVGSTGIVLININNDSTLTATLIIDHVTYNFTTTQTVNLNQSTQIHFVNGTNSFNFNVGANGSNPYFSSISINGHSQASIVIVKETSNSLVRCFEGTFNGDNYGTWNGVVKDNIFKGIALSDLDGSTIYANGNVANNRLSGTVSTGATFDGSYDGLRSSGTWIDQAYSESGTWNVTRTY